jgi:uncharacterized protein (DUF169 family)
MQNKRDYSILNKIEFDYPPVGVKFSLDKPEGIEPLGGKYFLCELIKFAHAGKAFYVSDLECGNHVLGYVEYPPIMYSGQLGPIFNMFKSPEANRRIYDYTPHLPYHSVKYITQAPLDKMNFEPDLLIFTTKPPQAEILLRASSYADGKMWHSRATTCLACAWTYAQPYMSGEMNYTITGLGFSMKAIRALPEGLIIISFPSNTIGSLLENLNEMEMFPHWFELGKEGFMPEREKREGELRTKLFGDPKKDAPDL